MTTEHLLLLSAGIFLIAILYSSVGHAGASGYIAVMSLMGLSAAVIRPSALSLNILVATIATIQFVRAGHFSWRLFWPFALLAIPCAFVGGYVSVPTPLFKVLLGLTLLYAAARFIFVSSNPKTITPPALAPALASGAVIGLLSGLTGTGGGIFLTPLILLAGWAQPKPAAAVSAAFILLNSIAGLLGNFSSTQALPSYLAPLLISAAAGGFIGSHFGSRHLAPQAIKRFLAAVLLIAGTKLLLT